MLCRRTNLLEKLEALLVEVFEFAEPVEDFEALLDVEEAGVLEPELDVAVGIQGVGAIRLMLMLMLVLMLALVLLGDTWGGFFGRR